MTQRDLTPQNAQSRRRERKRQHRPRRGANPRCRADSCRIRATAQRDSPPLLRRSPPIRQWRMVARRNRRRTGRRDRPEARLLLIVGKVSTAWLTGGSSSAADALAPAALCDACVALIAPENRPADRQACRAVDGSAPAPSTITAPKAAQATPRGSCARTHTRSHGGPAFGLLAGVQSLGNLVASGVAGVLWTAVSPAGGLPFAAALVLVTFACSRGPPASGRLSSASTGAS